MFITGPEVVKTVTHEEVTIEELGGADTHTAALGRRASRRRRRGRADRRVRAAARFLPQNNLEPVPRVRSADPPDRCDAELDTLVPGPADAALRHEAT